MIYFTSDWHLYHFNIIKYCDRPFNSVDEMNWHIIDNFLSTVKKEDTLYYLGDLTFKKGQWFKDKFRYFVPQLPDNTYFIYGNHDKMKLNDYNELGFNNVSKNPVEITLEGVNFLLTHEPTNIDSTDIVNIHGHVHHKWKTEYATDKNTLLVNVSVEVWDYFPVSIDQILSEVQTKRGYL